MNLDFITQLLGTLQPKKKVPMTPPFVPPTATPTFAGQPPAIMPPPIAPPAIPDRDPARFAGLAQSPQFGLGPEAAAIAPPAIDPTTAFVGTSPAQRVAVPSIPVPTAGIPAITPPMVEPGRSELEEDFAQVTGKRYNKGVYRNPETRETTNNPRKPGFTETVTAPGKDRDKKWSLGEKVLGALVGWARGGIAGGIQGATDRNFMEKLGDENELARVLPRIAAEQQIEQKHAQSEATRARPEMVRAELRRKISADKRRFDNQTAALEAKGKAEADKWKPYVDEQGRRWKQFLNDPSREMEPIIDPTTREQDVDPMQKMYEWTDPTSGQTVPLKGNQLATVGATIASGNAQREQAATTTNASNALSVAKENANNHLTYQSQLSTLLKEAIGADAAVANDGTTTGLRAQFESTQQELNSLSQQRPDDTDEKAVKAWTDRVNKLSDDLRDLGGKLFAEVGKTEAGRTKAAELKAAMSKLSPPPKLTYKPIKAAKVVVPKAKVSEQVFRKRLEANGIRDAAQQNAMIQRAKSDGVIQ